MTYLRHSATAACFTLLLVSACTQANNGEPATPPAAQPGALPPVEPGAQPAPETPPAAGTQRGATDARRPLVLRPIGGAAPQPGAQPSQPAPAPAGPRKATAVPGSGGGDATNAQACVDALNAASAKSCEEARALAQQCGTDQQPEIIAAVEQACQGT